MLCAMTPFDVLDVRRDASDADVHAQYREIAMLVHPDRGGTDEAFQRPGEAYE